MKEAAADELENSIASVVIQSFINPDSTDLFLLFGIAAGQELDSKGLILANVIKLRVKFPLK